MKNLEMDPEILVICGVLVIILMYKILYCSIYSGHHSILIPPAEVETNPALWLSMVGQHKGKPYLLLAKVIDISES